MSNNFCTFCHLEIVGERVKSTNKLWTYHPACYKPIKDKPLSWYKEQTKYTRHWDYLFGKN